jgi:hypothetical protein
LIAWPVSAGAGQGRVVLHDFLFGTQVLHKSTHVKSKPARISRFYAWIVVFTGMAASTIIDNVFFGPATTQVASAFETSSKAAKLELFRMAEVLDNLTLNIENGPEFLPGGGQVSLWRWPPDMWKRWSVKRSCFHLPDDIRDGHLKFHVYANYVIPVWPRGLSSTTFQTAFVAGLSEQVVHLDMPVTIELVYASRVWIFYQVIKKRYIAFAYKNPLQENAQPIMCILEPDYSMMIKVGTSYGDSGSRLVLMSLAADTPSDY